MIKRSGSRGQLAVLATVLVLFTTGCQTLAVSDSTPRARVDCAGTPFEVAFTGDRVQRAELIGPNGQRELLSIAPAASGSRYANVNTSYWEHHGRASISFGDRQWEDCAVQAAPRR
jgi:membrane-bound inhibitor of C-type lysozyme